MLMLAVSIVILVYRAKQTLIGLYSKLFATMSEMTSVFEIVFAESGCGDVSRPIVAYLARPDHRVRGVQKIPGWNSAIGSMSERRS
jgi:hypothetical protein